jgi:simple sugar transport system permease protein
MKFSKEWILFAVFVVLFLAMSLIAPNFLTSFNIENMLSQVPELAILTLGMLVVVLTAGIDLSMTYMASASGIVTVHLLSTGHGLLVSILAGLLVAVVFGLLNGFVIAYIGVTPILATLGSMTLFEGLGQLFTKGKPISGFPASYSVIGNGSIGPIPFSLLILAILAVVTGILLNRTRWGRSVYMLGSNPVATLFSGIHTKRVLMWVYTFSGIMAGIAAVIMTSRYNSASYDLGTSYLLQSISAAVLGGADIAGGYGKVTGALLGVGIFEILADGLQLLGIPSAVVDVLMGGVLILVLLLNFATARYKTTRFRMATSKQKQIGIPT